MKVVDRRPPATPTRPPPTDEITVSRIASGRPADAFRAWLAAGVHRRWQSALLKTAWGRVNIKRVLLAEGGERLASATRYSGLGLLDRRPVRVRGLGDVSAPGDSPADEAARQALVEHVMVDARDSGVDVALLFSPLDAEWCRAHDFIDITPDTLTLAVRPDRRPGAPMVMIRAGEDRDLPAIADMGQTQAAQFRFSLDRGVDFIQHGIISRRLLAGLAARGTRELHFFVVEEGSTAVAYILLSVTAGEWWIEACGDRDPSGYRIGCILEALVAREPSAPPPCIRGWLPAGLIPPQVAVVARERTPTTVMAALIGRDATAQRLTAADVLYWKADVF